MEDALRERVAKRNPEGYTVVLILVLMEDALRDKVIRLSPQEVIVLILVLMEDALRVTYINNMRKQAKS